MTVAALLAEAEAAGARFRLGGAGQVRVIAGNAGSDLLAELRQHRDDLAAILAQRDATTARLLAGPPAYPRHPDALREGLLAGWARLVGRRQ